MGYFNWEYIFMLLKKYFSIVGFLLLVMLCLFMIFANSNSVRAETPTIAFRGISQSGFTNNDATDILNCFNSVKGDNRYFVCTLKQGENSRLVVFNDFRMIYAFYTGRSNLQNESFSYSMYWLLGGGRVQLIGNYTGQFTNPYDYNGNYPFVYGNVPIFDYDKTNYLWVPEDFVVSSFVAPALYPNASQDQTPLTSGNFTFFIVNPGSVPETSSIQLDFFDTSADNNGNPLVSEITLDKNSAFFQYTNIEETEYHYVITARFLNWFKLINGKSYRAVLAYYDSNNQYQSITYNWTMSISSAQQEIINQQTEQDINQGINDLNNSVNETNEFLKDDSYNQQGIVNNMPSSEQYSDPASSGLLTIFNSLKNAFTTTSNQPVRFYIPFTDGNYIDLPPDLTISHVPQPILFIIRALYWYIICRYIVKDISNTANKAKSGELLDSKDGNIRTELL